MKLLSSYKYNMKSYKNTGIVLAVVILTLLVIQAALLIVGYFTISSTEPIMITASGFDTIITLFIFIMACTTFKNNFNMQMQNSVSRKTQFNSTLLSGITFCAITAFGFVLLFVLVNVFLTPFYINLFPHSKEMLEANYQFFDSAYYTLFFPAKALNFSNVFWTFLVILTTNFAAFLLGCLCSNIFYRLPNDVLRVVVFLSPFFLIFMVFPIFDFICFEGELTIALGNFIDAILGLSTFEPWKFTCSFIVASIFVAVIFFLVHRKTSVKK